MKNLESPKDFVAEGGRYLCFTLGSDKFAIPLAQIKQVIGNVKTTPIPHAPQHFKGIIDLRGQIISIIDLRLKFKTTKAANDEQNEKTIIIVEFEDLQLGVLVDSVDMVTTFEGKDLSPPPNVDSKGSANFISAVAKSDKNLTLIVNLQLALSAEDQKTLRSPNVRSA